MTNTYLNPVYNQSFPDPFVLKYRNEYWAYCTGDWPDGRRFGVLRSRDLVHWQPLAGALAPLPEQHPHYWAPEVTYYNGRFYLYYSAGDEATMQMRVAVAEHPVGPFVDSGQRLTKRTICDRRACADRRRWQLVPLLRHRLFAALAYRHRHRPRSAARPIYAGRPATAGDPAVLQLACLRPPPRREGRRALAYGRGVVCAQAQAALLSDV